MAHAILAGEQPMDAGTSGNNPMKLQRSSKEELLQSPLLPSTSKALFNNLARAVLKKVPSGDENTISASASATESPEPAAAAESSNVEMERQVLRPSREPSDLEDSIKSTASAAETVVNTEPLPAKSESSTVSSNIAPAIVTKRTSVSPQTSRKGSKPLSSAATPKCDNPRGVSLSEYIEAQHKQSSPNGKKEAPAKRESRDGQNLRPRQTSLAVPRDAHEIIAEEDGEPEAAGKTPRGSHTRVPTEFSGNVIIPASTVASRARVQSASRPSRPSISAVLAKSTPPAHRNNTKRASDSAAP